MNSPITPESRALSKICREWYITFGLLTLIVVLSLWISPLWMPLIEIALAIFLALFGPARVVSGDEPCGRLTIVAVYTLLFAGIVSFCIDVAYKTTFIHTFFDISTLNHSIPYITSLVVFPVCVVISLIVTMPSLNQRHIRRCHLHNEYNPSSPMFSRIVHATYLSLLKRLLFITLIISIIDWAYYFLAYDNKSINTPDRFFFFVVPAAIYVWSIIFVRQSYSVLSLTNGKKIYADSNATFTLSAPLTNSHIVRLLVVQNDCLLLDLSEQSISECNVDTPYLEIKPNTFQVTDQSAGSLFEHRTGISSFKIKKLFTNERRDTNNVIYHYMVFLDDDTDTSLLKGQWTPIEGIDRLLKMGVTSPSLSDEIYRIYTIAMAWKTYDRNGRRLYPIRNYRPTFRLGDILKWDVDFSDNRWLKVARINQDNLFWFVRRLWLK